MFPYIEQPILRLGGVEISAFQLCVFAAVVTGYEIVVRRAARLGWSADDARSLVLWTIALGFVGSHLFEMLLYEFDTVKQRPLVLLEVWGSMSSFGGLIGGIGGGALVIARRGLSREQVASFFDVVAFAFPFSWIWGRLGCALAHDHLGVRSDSALAVRFPGGPRYDLGLLELIWTVAVALLWLALDRKRRPLGFYAGLFFVLYAPVRFWLDSLRTGDERYLGWTPGQFAALAGGLAGAAVLAYGFRRANAKAAT